MHGECYIMGFTGTVIAVLSVQSYKVCILCVVLLDSKYSYSVFDTVTKTFNTRHSHRDTQVITRYLS